jgi:hypothetical protein
MHTIRLATKLPFAVLLTAGLWLACVFSGCAQGASGTAAGPGVAPAQTPQKVINTKPDWKELTAAQKQALSPLSQLWPTMTEAHKRKWLALSQNFSQLPDLSLIHI